MTGSLVQAKALLESLVQKVLLGPRFHGLLFSHRLLDDLLHHFLSHDFSVSCIRQGLQVQRHPLMSDGGCSFWLHEEVMVWGLTMLGIASGGVTGLRPHNLLMDLHRPTLRDRHTLMYMCCLVNCSLMTIAHCLCR